MVLNMNEKEKALFEKSIKNLKEMMGLKSGDILEQFEVCPCCFRPTKEEK